MKDIKIKIECPEGYQIDEENSDIKNGIIKFKQKKLTYNDIAEEQLESILALNKLCNVAKYLNKEWLPNWDDTYEKKYYFSISLDELLICPIYTTNDGAVYFKTKELAQRAIEILGEKEIKKALILNH
jgi:hypothetical protein